MARYLFLISFLFSGASIATAFLGVDTPTSLSMPMIVPPLLALIAFFLGGEAIKRVSRSIDVFFYIIAAFCIAIALQPISFGWPWFFASSFFLAAMPFLRILFFQRIGFLKAVWYEPLISLCALAFYIIANFFSPIGWEGWAFPALPIATSLFRGFGTIMDKKTILGKVKDNFNAVIGVLAPDFSLTDHNGDQIKLSDFRGKNSVLLIFVRGDWCPSCHITLRAYERNKEKFQKNNVIVMAIGPDPIGVNKEMVKKLGLSYHILADEKKECAYKYGVQLHENNPLTKYDVGVPLPATFLVSVEGKVAYTSRADNPGEIFFPEDIFPVLEKIALAK